MKRVILSIFAFAALTLIFSNDAAAQSFNAIENQARAAAIHCAQPYMAPHATIEVDLVSTPHCINGGTVYVHNVFVVYHCPPRHGILCLVVAPVLVATVSTDCDGHVANVTCY